MQGTSAIYKNAKTILPCRLARDRLARDQVVIRINALGGLGNRA